MGDRCYLEFRVHKDDMDEYKKTWADHFGDAEEEGDRPGLVIEEQANFAEFSARAQMAQAGVRFYGNSGPGGEYGGALHYADNNMLFDWPGTSVTELELDPRDTDQIGRAKTFVDEYKRMEELIDKSWEDE